MLKLFKQIPYRKWWLGAALASATILPLSVALSCSTSAPTLISIDGLTFNSVDELATHIQKHSQTANATSEAPQYQITEGASKSTYQDLSELSAYIEKTYVKEQNSYFTVAALKERDNVALNNAARAFVANNRIFNTVPITSDPRALRQVYRGASGELLFDRDAALKTYLQVHNAYQFDNMYFASEGDLRDYLANDYDYANIARSTYHLRDVNGNTSASLVVNNETDLASGVQVNNELTQQRVREFVSANAETYVKQNRQASLRLADFDATKLSASSLPVFQLNNTSGRSSYIIDVKTESDGALFGPSVLTSAYSPVNRITESSYWARSKVDMQDQQAFSNLRELLFSQFINMRLGAKDDIGTFVDLIFADPRALDPEYDAWLSAHPEFANTQVSSNFFSDIRSFISSKTYPFNFSDRALSLRRGLEHVETILQQGQNYGFVSALSILRSWALNEMINNGASTHDLTLINLAFDNATYYLNFLVHQSLDSFLSPEAKAYNLVELFDFANTQTFGEDPAVYITRMESGLVNGKAAPSLTEIILTMPLATLLVTSASDRKAEDAALREWNSAFGGVIGLLKPKPTNLPTSLNGIASYIDAQKQWRSDLGLNELSPSLRLMEWFKLSFDTFKEADSSAGQRQALSTLRVNSTAFRNLEARTNEYLALISAYWQNIDPATIGSRTPSDDAQLASFDWRTASNQDLSDYVAQLLRSNTQTAPVTAFSSFDNFVSADFTAFEVLGIFNEVAEMINEADDVKVSKAAELGTALTKSFGMLRKFSGILSKALVAIAVLDVALELIMGIIGKVELLTYNYIHNRGEATYFWNGGSVRTHNVFGVTWESEEKSIKTDEILLPIVIRSESTQDFYYYASNLVGTENRYNHYRTLDEVKRAYLADLKQLNPNRQVVSPFFEYGLTLAHNGEQVTLKGATINDLATQVLAAAPRFVERKLTAFGQTYDPSSESKAALTARALQVIKANPLWITQLPAIIDNALARAPYYLPITNEQPLYATYTERANTKLVTPQLASAAVYQNERERIRQADALLHINRSDLYLIYQTATIKELLGSTAPVRVEDVLALAKAAFEMRFNVPTKLVLFSDIYRASGEINFDNVLEVAATDNQPALVPVFKATSGRGEVSHFFDRGEAIAYVLGSLNFTRLSSVTNTSALVYHGRTFNSLNEAIAWVLELNQASAQGSK